jgi:hypothetical protein
VARNHIIISGTGRAGTTFLVQILSEMGMDTGFGDSYHDVDQNCNAGLEKDIFKKNSPYIIKNPWLATEIEKVVNSDQIIIDHAIIPIRDIFEAAESRRDVTKRSGVDKKRIAPGGVWGTDDPERLENVLAMQLYRLIYFLVNKNIPITMLDFPRFALDKEYFYDKMLNVFPDLDHELFSKAFDKTADPTKIHKFDSNIKSDAAPISAKATYKHDGIIRKIKTMASNLWTRMQNL